MNIARGLFRLWLVCSVLYILVIALFSYQPVRREFAKQAAETRYIASLTVPVMCHDARGVANTDYEPTKGFDNPINPFSSCWYTMEKYRKLFPEDAGKSDARVIADGYGNNGATMPDLNADPWKATAVAIGIAAGPPIFLLVIGMAFVWAFAGFKRGAA